LRRGGGYTGQWLRRKRINPRQGKACVRPLAERKNPMKTQKKTRGGEEKRRETIVLGMLISLPRIDNEGNIRTPSLA